VSTFYCLAFSAAIAVLAGFERALTLTVCLLSYWHYYLYWLAYTFRAVPLQTFKDDAILMKAISLCFLAWIYFNADIYWPSLAIVGAGLLLNLLAAQALGSDRTYYGYELAGLPWKRVAQFPYSWIAHPMLAGNIVAFGATLINPAFRARWWPVAAAHVALNLAVLTMEIVDRPFPRGVALQAGRRQETTRSSSSWVNVAAVCASTEVAAASGAWTAAQTNALAGSLAAICVGSYGFSMFRCYTSRRGQSTNLRRMSDEHSRRSVVGEPQ
jgi:hypothetical protein